MAARPQAIGGGGSPHSVRCSRTGGVAAPAWPSLRNKIVPSCFKGVFAWQKMRGHPSGWPAKPARFCGAGQPQRWPRAWPHLRSLKRQIGRLRRSVLLANAAQSEAGTEIRAKLILRSDPQGRCCSVALRIGREGRCGFGSTQRSLSSITMVGSGGSS